VRGSIHASTARLEDAEELRAVARPPPERVASGGEPNWAQAGSEGAGGERKGCGGSASGLGGWPKELRGQFELDAFPPAAMAAHRVQWPSSAAETGSQQERVHCRRAGPPCESQCKVGCSHRSVGESPKSTFSFKFYIQPLILNNLEKRPAATLAIMAAGSWAFPRVHEAVRGITKRELSRSLMDFVCFDCGRVVDSSLESEFRHWCNSGKACMHRVTLNVTTMSLRDIEHGRIPSGAAIEVPEMRAALEHLHQQKRGNLDDLYPELRMQAYERLQKRVAEVNAASESLEGRWKAFHDRFDDVMSALAKNIAASMGVSLTVVAPCSDEDRRSVFDGAVPSRHALVERWKARPFRNVVVLAGAGISTNSGIPDFRSPDGLYTRLRRDGFEHPEDLFSLHKFREDPSMFYAHAHMLVPHHLRKRTASGAAAVASDGAVPTVTHRFLKLLHDKGCLKRVLTQNIDDLERAAGVPDDKIVQAHGSFRSARCVECGTEVDRDVVVRSLSERSVCHCPYCDGPVKPDIVFFGEELPPEFHAARDTDMSDCDLVLVMGTSLTVYPFNSLLPEAPATAPRVLLNMELVRGVDAAGDAAFRAVAETLSEDASGGADPDNYRDIAITGDIDETVRWLCDQLGWSLDDA
jgi:NAD+-dependent protein deacetylase sirtuin 2